MTEKNGLIPMEKPKHRPFSELIEEFNDGQTHAELTTSTHEVLSRLQDIVSMDSGKAKGTLTLKIGFELNDKGVVAISADIKTNVPKRKIAVVPMWMDRNGTLTDENPKQQKIKFLDANAKKAE